VKRHANHANKLLELDLHQFMANMGIDPALLRRLQQAGGMDMFAMKRGAAKKLQDAEKSGRPIAPELDFRYVGCQLDDAIASRVARV
jgi:hypothetical protein